jgi:hypothetical protein
MADGYAEASFAGWDRVRYSCWAMTFSVECRAGSAMSRSAEAATTVIIGIESGTDNYKESEQDRTTGGDRRSDAVTEA